MKIAMMQPAFFPWQGLFELIKKSDKFIFLDDFQFVVQSHHTRNKLFVNKDQVDYYGVPVQKSKCFGLKLNETLIVEDNFWKKKTLKRLSNVYQKTSFFNEIYPQIENWLNQDYASLAHLNIEGIKLFCKMMNIQTPFLYSSDFPSEAKRTEKVIALLKWAKADMYLSASGSFDYMLEDNYDYKSYPVLFQNYQPRPYKQFHSSEFVPYLSVLDALFNIGPAETVRLIDNGTQEWLSFEDMIKRHGEN